MTPKRLAKSPIILCEHNNKIDFVRRQCSICGLIFLACPVCDGYQCSDCKDGVMYEYNSFPSQQM
jgi:hypothetical protein